MTHHINLRPLRAPVAQVRYPARQLALWGLIALGLIGAGTVAWVMQCHSQARAALAQVQAQQAQLAALQQQLGMEGSAVALSAPALAQALQARQQELGRLQTRLQQLQRGVMVQGAGHAARLALVAQTIPPTTWLTQLKLDDQRWELSGATLEPAALNAWLNALSASPLLARQTLHTVKVERSALREGAVRAGKDGVWQFVLSAGAP